MQRLLPSKKIGFLLILLAGLLVGVGNVEGADRYSVATGNWNSTATWSASSGGSPGASVPVAGDNVFVESGFTVTVSANAACANLDIASGSTLTVGGFNITVSGTTVVNGTLTHNNTNGTKIYVGLVTVNSGGVWDNSGNESVTFRGGIINNGTFTAGTGIQTFNTNAQSIEGTLSIPTTTVTAIVLTNNGTLTVGTLLSGTGNLTNASTGILNIDGTGTSCSITTIANAGTINRTNTGTTTTPLLTFTNTGTINLNGSGTIAGITNNAGGTINLASSGTITSLNNATSTSILNISTTPTVPIITTLTATVEGNTVNYNGTGSQTVKGTTYAILNLSGSGTKTLGAATILNGNLTIDSGVTLATANQALTLRGDFLNNGTFTAGSSAITISGANIQSIAGFATTGLVSMTKTAGTATFQGNVNGAGLTINGSGGTLNLGAGLDHTFTGVVTLTAGTLHGGSSTLHENATSGTAWNGTGTVFDPGSGTVDFGGANQTISASATTFNNLVFSGSGTKTIGSITIGNGGSVTSSNLALAFTGNFVSNGTAFNAGSSVITFSGTNNQSIDGFTTTGGITVSKTGGTATFNGNVNAASITSPTSATNSILAINSGVTLDLSGGITLSRPPSGSTTGVTISVGSGTLSCSSIALGGTGATSGRSTTVSISTGTVNVSGNVTFGGTYSYITFTGNGNLNIGGNLGNGGTFTSGTGTVNYNAAGAQTIGNYTYNNLTLSGSGLKTEATATVNGVLSMEGPATISAVPTYGAGATLQYNGSTSQTTGPEFPATFIGTGGVIINNSSGVTFGAAKQITNNFSITSGSIANLGTFTHAVGTLTLGGNGTGSGSWGSTTSSAIYKNDTYFDATTGIVNVSASSCTILPPEPGSGGNQTICSGETIPSLTAAVGVGQTVDWYTASSGGTLLLAGNTSYTPTGAGAYYAEARNTTTGCVSASRTAVALIENNPPSVTSTSPGSRCGTGTVVISATASSGTLNWYDAPSGGNYLGTGSPFTTLAISSTTTFYVDATDGSCTTATRTPILASIIPSPSITAGGGGSFCAGTNVSLTSNGINITNQYWTGPNSFYSLDQNPVISNATTAMSGTYIVTGSSLSTANLVTNGNFSSGNTGFTTAYTLAAQTSSGLNPEGAYDVVPLPSSRHSNFCTCGDHTSGSGLQMVINGASTESVIWSQTVNVVPNTAYQFTYWVQTVVNGNDSNPSKIQLFVNGSNAGVVYTANAMTGLWTQFTYNWTSGSGVTTAILDLKNENFAAGGNDFALDDIVFQQACEATSSVDVTVDPTSVGGSVNGGTTICSGSTSGLLTLTGHTGTIAKWQSSVSPFSSWTDISNTTTTYTSGALIQTTRFRAVVASGACTPANSAETTVTVIPSPAPGEIIAD